MSFAMKNTGGKGQGYWLKLQMQIRRLIYITLDCGLTASKDEQKAEDEVKL